MAYFPNGTAGELFESRECFDCIHEGPPEGPGCAIMLIHLVWNYDQCDNEQLQDVMQALIDDEGQPLGKMCQMRVAKEDDPNQISLDLGDPGETDEVQNMA